ncbi:MAG: hypothetical protein ABEN55_21720 [Bradymonadaceae bacterium]
MTDSDDMQSFREDLLADKCDRETFEHNGRTLNIREMNVAEYTEFTTIPFDDAEQFLPFVLSQVTRKDGRQAFEEEHLDSLLELPHTDSVVGKINRNFLRVNDFIAADDGPDINEDRLRTLALEADDEQTLGQQVRELLGVDDDEPDDAQIGAAVRQLLEIDEGDEGKPTTSENG